MKKKFLHADKVEILLSVLLFLLALFVLRRCGRDTAYAADKEQTIEMIHYQQSQGRFAVEEKGYINILLCE
jgi:hypothetical protein